MSRVQLLRTHGVEPIIVFDGGRLPIKGEEEETRHRLVHRAADLNIAVIDGTKITAL